MESERMFEQITPVNQRILCNDSRSEPSLQAWGDLIWRGQSEKKILADWLQTAAQRGDLREQLLGCNRLDWFVCTWEILECMAIKTSVVWGRAVNMTRFWHQDMAKERLDDVLVTFAQPVLQALCLYSHLLPFCLGLLQQILHRDANNHFCLSFMSIPWANNSE